MSGAPHRGAYVEAQMFAEDGFDKRMYDYNRKAEEVYNSPVVSRAILGDERADWRPDRYRFDVDELNRLLASR